MNRITVMAPLLAAGLVGGRYLPMANTLMRTVGTTCAWDGDPITLTVGEAKTVEYFGGPLECHGSVGTISPADDGAGFNLDCSLASTTGPLFKVRGCAGGDYTLTITYDFDVYAVITIHVVNP